MCMYDCMHVYVYGMVLYVCMPARTPVWLHDCMIVCMYGCLYRCMCVYECMCVYVCVCICV